MKFLEYIIPKLIELRNDRARSKTKEYFESWNILKQKARKLSPEEIDF